VCCGVVFAAEKKMDKTKVNQAVSYFNEGMSCSQAILTAYGQEFGIDRGLSLKISAPFGGGMARMGETCGAVTGALMVLGLKYATGKDAKDKLFALENEFAEKFKEHNNSINCRKLLNCDLANPEERKVFVEKGLAEKLCRKFVKDAAEILEELLQK
jgi:C_GCAxxG_C_C family probable redox protein